MNRFTNWRKSSRSGSGNNCVELAHHEAAAAVRDSKNPAGPVLVFRRDQVAGFVAAVKTGRLA